MTDIHKQKPARAADKTAGPAPTARKAATRSAPRTPYDGTLEEHREIRRTIRQLTELLDEYRVGMQASAWRLWMAGFSGKLFGLRERLLEHFREEELSGLYEALSEKLPTLVPRTHVVRDEHKMILDELEGILGSLPVLRSTLPLEPKILDQTREALYRIVCHERKESDLIARAYLEEMGHLD